jgi:hypothetical protein
MAFNYGIKTVKLGKDINSVNPNDYTFNSKYNMFKVYLEEFSTISLTEGVEFQKNSTHDLAYKPHLLGYFKHPSNGMWHLMPCNADINTGAGWLLGANFVNIDDNTVQVRVRDGILDPMPSTPTDIDLKLFIMADPRDDTWFEPATTDTDNYLGNKDYGFKVARQGINVLTAEPKNLVYSSALSTLKVAQIIKFNYDATRTPANISSKNHSLNFPPAFIGIKEYQFTAGQFETAVDGYNQGGMSRLYVDESSVYYTQAEECWVLIFAEPLNE